MFSSRPHESWEKIHNKASVQKLLEETGLNNKVYERVFDKVIERFKKSDREGGIGLLKSKLSIDKHPELLDIVVSYVDQVFQEGIINEVESAPEVVVGHQESVTTITIQPGAKENADKEPLSVKKQKNDASRVRRVGKGKKDEEKNDDTIVDMEKPDNGENATSEETKNVPVKVVVKKPDIDPAKVFGKGNKIDTSKIEEAVVLRETTDTASARNELDKKSDDVNPESKDEIDRKHFVELLKQNTFKKIIVHGGPLRMSDDGEVIATPQTDADAQFATFLFHLAQEKGGVNGIESIEFVPQGGSLEEGIHLDSGERDGISLEIENGKHRAFFDHHAKEKKESTSATALSYDFFVKNGIFDEQFIKENPHLEKIRDFITAVDNFDHVTLKPGEKPRTQEYITQEYPRTLAATYKLLPFSFILERFKKGISADEPFSEEELNTVIKTKDGKGESVLRDIVDRTKDIFDKSYWLALNRKKRAESIGVVERTQELGTVFVDIERKDGTGRLGRGNEITRMRGFDTFVQWNESKKSFFISSAKDMSAAFEKIKPIAPGAKLIRGVMIVMPETGVNQREKVQGTIDQFLLALDLIDTKDAEKAQKLVQVVEQKKKKTAEPGVSEENKNEAMASVEILRNEREEVMTEFRRLKAEGLFTAEAKADIEQKLLAIKAKQEKALAVLERALHEEETRLKKPTKKNTETEIKTSVQTTATPENAYTALVSKEETVWQKMEEPAVIRAVEDMLQTYKYTPSAREKDELLHVFRDGRDRAVALIANAQSARKRAESIEAKERRLGRLTEINTHLTDSLKNLQQALQQDMVSLINEYKQNKA
jgi:hypothetical protein